MDTTRYQYENFFLQRFAQQRRDAISIETRTGQFILLSQNSPEEQINQAIEVCDYCDYWSRKIDEHLITSDMTFDEALLAFSKWPAERACNRAISHFENCETCVMAQCPSRRKHPALVDRIRAEVHPVRTINTVYQPRAVICEFSSHIDKNTKRSDSIRWIQYTYITNWNKN